jgi:hypothetical protein
LLNYVNWVQWMKPPIRVFIFLHQMLHEISCHLSLYFPYIVLWLWLLCWVILGLRQHSQICQKLRILVIRFGIFNLIKWPNIIAPPPKPHLVGLISHSEIITEQTQNSNHIMKSNLEGFKPNKIKLPNKFGVFFPPNSTS